MGHEVRTHLAELVPGGDTIPHAGWRGIVPDVERAVDHTRSDARMIADLTGHSVTWTVNHRPAVDPLGWSSWSGTAHPGDAHHAPYQAAGFVSRAITDALDAEAGR